MSKTELTTMCALRSGNKVLMINRIKSWPGWAFPGGHLENNESLLQCAKREIFEETGLRIKSLQYKGITHIYNTVTGKRHIVSNYIAEQFSGDIKKKCDEGEIRWVDISEIKKLPLAEGFEYRIPLFLEEGIQELYIEWDEENYYTRIEYSSL